MGNQAKEVKAKVKKPFYKRWWFIAICVIVVISAISNAAGGGAEKAIETSNTSASSVVEQKPITDTPESTPAESSVPEMARAAELRAQYPTYDKAAKEIQSKMSVTAEQADDIFIILTTIGLEGAITNVIKNNDDNSNYTVQWSGSGSGYVVELNNGVIDNIREWKLGSEPGTAVYPESLVESERLAAESAASEAEGTAKTVAVLMDSQLIGFVENSQEIVVLLQEGVDLLQSTNDVVSLYSLADTAEDSQRSLQTSLRSVRDNDNKDYVSAIEQYIINGQLICEKLKKYLDGGSLENLTDMQSRLKFSESYYGDVLDARKDYLLNQGLSESEIAEIFMK